MIRTHLLLSISCIAISVFQGCGTKSKDEQASDFYKEKLRPDEQSDCNQKGKVFDFSVSGSAACTNIPLAKFNCDGDNVKKELSGKANAAAVVKASEASLLFNRTK